MSLFKKGADAKAAFNKTKVDLKKVHIRLKGSDSVRVRLLSTDDYVNYSAHGSFNLGVYTQPCVKPLGQECVLCKAAENEEYNKELYARTIFVFAFADIDAGEVRVLDVSKNQAKGLIEQIESYKDDINDVAFVLKKTGAGATTGYSLQPILKMKSDDKEKFTAAEELTVEDSLYEAVLKPRDAKYQIKILNDAGFPVVETFGQDVVDAALTETTESDEKVDTKANGTDNF